MLHLTNNGFMQIASAIVANLLTPISFISVFSFKKLEDFFKANPKLSAVLLTIVVGLGVAATFYSLNSQAQEKVQQQQFANTQKDIGTQVIQCVTTATETKGIATETKGMLIKQGKDTGAGFQSVNDHIDKKFLHATVNAPGSEKIRFFPNTEGGEPNICLDGHTQHPANFQAGDKYFDLSLSAGPHSLLVWNDSWSCDSTPTVGAASDPPSLICHSLSANEHPSCTSAANSPIK